MSTLSFDLEQILDAAKKLNTKDRSYSFGRRLYELSIDGQTYWLKTQLNAECSNHAVCVAFQHELKFYQSIDTQLIANVILPFQNIQQSFTINGETFTQGLLLKDAKSCFDQPPLNFSKQDIQQFFINVIEPLVLLEQQGILHADLKVEHFRKLDDRICLIDFEQYTQIGLTTSKMLNATPRYMSPELFHGAAKSMQSDMYALGIIFLEWLSQERLNARSYQDWAYLHCQRLNVELEGQFQAFETILKRMLAKRVEQRIASFVALKQMLLTEIE